MSFHFSTELSQLSREIKHFPFYDLSSTKDEVKFKDSKEKVLSILKEMYGETSREFRVVELTASPATVVKVVDHILGRTHMIPANAKVVNL
ncbi:hypothetical protein REC12_17605 [Desulfosporosinus sp. PR]|uniref:hypothetical protein n=1 Tax=Candidatus Desulfosporosinus nitrosoreducens TaxID=3401928 RepID=UPI0027F07DA1|nr:hypothetical protein [Desulfosporosinus sp. PR]MDQ7095410.1 hypothetical protein [Desulfosporosinus sp. PR]